MWLGHLSLLLSFCAFVLGRAGPDKLTGCQRVCYNGGSCLNDTHCSCNPGWTGSHCETCMGRIRLSSPSGFISDGPTNYTINMRCAWLLDGGAASRVVLRLETFVTECAWDHVFLYDGDGIYAPQLAALSGALTPVRDASNSEFIANSGRAFVYFFSDLAYNMQGFNISYKINGCPYDCHGHGVCDTSSGLCSCHDGWSGPSCHISCDNTCRLENTLNGACTADGKCDCLQLFHGPDCSTPIGESVWEEASKNGLGARASHASVVQDDSLFVTGGTHFVGSEFSEFAMYNFTSGAWVLPPIDCDNFVCPEVRYDHSLVSYMDNLYMFGGVMSQHNISSSLWRLSVSSWRWSLVTPGHYDYLKTPYHAAGHTAHVVGNVMVVVFGYNQFRGYMDWIQEYHFANNSWLVPATSGSGVIGTYGHSSVLDAQTSRIYVFGGYYSQGKSAGAVSDRLYAYDPVFRKWSILNSAGHQVFKHGAALLNGIMVVVGGNSHNESTVDRETVCYAEKILAYDTECDSWYSLSSPKNLSPGVGRYGHSVVEYKGHIYLYGGFNGKMLDNMLKFSTGECHFYGDRDACVNSRQGVKCVWLGDDKGCQSSATAKAEHLFPDDKHPTVDKYSSGDGAMVQSDTCPNDGSSFAVHRLLKCEELVHCNDCTGPLGESCVWCGGKCERICPSGKEVAEVQSECPLETAASDCYLLDTCYACKSRTHCRWYTGGSSPFGTCKDKSDIIPTTPETPEEDQPPTPTGVLSTATTVPSDTCLRPCADYGGCADCVGGGCMWCDTVQRCVNINSYMPSFPYGSCTEWTSSNQADACKKPTDCESQQTCADCRGVGPRCGWCDDGSGTGLGFCVNGGYDGPVTYNDTLMTYNHNMTLCDKERWFFMGCPACQCNGHGHCSQETAKDGKASNAELACETCGDLTTGEHCQTCIRGFYGNALNGGNCTECECNGQATDCDPESGECYCTTKGVSGKHCDKCDQKYIGDPKNQTCFYELSVDFIFTFKLEGDDKKDRHISKINFVTRPTKQDTDVSFKLSCSGHAAKVNLSVYSGSFEHGWRRFLANSPCTELERTFSHEEFEFGTDANTTFFVYLYDFRTPVIIQISFAQSPPIDWGKFFLTFASCFILLLFGAALTWRIKMRVDTYRRRQRMFVEMAQMASRPFGSAQIELPSPHAPGHKLSPSPLSVEPCENYQAAVLTVAVRLPTGGRKYTPSGHVGLAVASALCQLTPTQANILQTPGTNEQQQKPKRRRNRTMEAYFGLRNWANTGLGPL